MKNWLFLSVLAILLASCSEPTDPGDPPPTGDTCSYFADNYIMDITTQWVYPTYQFEAVSINPNNANEFAYVRKHVANNTFELRKHNIGTHVDTWLADFPVTFGSLSWSKQGYIYHNTQNELHRIKEDGSSHDVYPYQAVLTRPVCSPDGELVAVDFVTVNPLAGYCAILDKNGNFIDSIEPGENIIFSWIDNDHIAFWYDKDYQIVNIHTKQTVSQGTFPEYVHLFYLLDNVGNYLITNAAKIFIYNRQANTTHLVKDNCGDNYSYSRASSAENLNKIVALRWKYHIIDSATKKVSFSTDIVRMNLDGSEEEVVLLPQ